MNDKREQIEGFTPGQFMYGVICAACGPQELTEAQHDAAWEHPNRPWTCPKCGGAAEWDDDSLATSGEDEESEWTCADCDRKDAENESLRAELQKTKSDALTMVDAADRHFATAQKLHSEVTRLESDASELRAEVARLREEIARAVILCEDQSAAAAARSLRSALKVTPP